MKLLFTSGTSAILIGLTLAAATRADALRTVAFLGDPAPGTGAGVNFNFLSSPVLNDSGQTAFLGTLMGTGVDGTNDKGFWSEGGGSGLQLVARAGDPAPGTSPEVNFSDFVGSRLLNASGQTAFGGVLTGTGVDGTNDTGIWSGGGGGGLQLVVRDGDPAPGTSPGVNFSVSFRGSSHVLNASGQTAFSGRLTGTGVDGTNNTGIWTEAAGSGLQLVVRAGDAAPGTSSGVNFSGLNSSVLNDGGQTAFSGRLTGTGVDGTNDSGIWSEGGGSGLKLVAREGDPAPGTGPGVNFRDFVGPRLLNASGQTAFLGSLTGTGVDGTNDEGIWSGGGGSGLQLAARAGDPAPGTHPGVNYSGLGFPVLNDSGQMAFSGRLTGTGVDGTNDEGIWSEGRGSGLQLIARAGDPAPGTSPGVNFSDFVGPLLLNARGQTAFRGFLTGTGVDSTNDWGIWGEDLSGQLTLIAREGDLLDVDDGPDVDLRTISGLGFIGHTGNGDGRPSGFNNLGQVAFRASFTDGSSGVFVSNLVAVPEPGTLLPGTLAGSILAAGALFRSRVARKNRE